MTLVYGFFSFLLKIWFLKWSILHIKRGRWINRHDRFQIEWTNGRNANIQYHTYGRIDANDANDVDIRLHNGLKMIVDLIVCFVYDLSWARA